MPSLFSVVTDLQQRWWQTALAAFLIAITAVAFIVHAALVRGSRAEAFRVAIAVGEGHLAILPAPGSGDSPRLIPDAGPIYTDPRLMRSGALVLPRMTLPVQVILGAANGLATLRGVEAADPQTVLLDPAYVEGTWPEAESNQVALGADLAQALGVGRGARVSVQLDRPGARPVAGTISALVRTGRDEWDAHGVWSGLVFARAVRGLRDAATAETVTHLSVFLEDPASSPYWRERLHQAGLPDFTEVREWWQLDLEPLRYTPQADPGLPWAKALLTLLAVGLVGNLLLGPVPLPRTVHGRAEGELRGWMLRAIGVQALAMAVAACLLAVLLLLMVRNGIAIGGSGPLTPRMFLPPGAVRLGDLLPPTIIPAWSLADAALLGVGMLLVTPLAAAVRLWRIVPGRRA